MDKEDKHRALPGEESSRPLLRSTEPSQRTVEPDPASRSHPNTSQHLTPDALKTGQRPLIDYVTNRWQNEETQYAYDEAKEEKEGYHELSCCDLDDDTSCPNATRRLLHSRRVRRMLALVLLLVLALYYLWSKLIWPRLEEERILAEGFQRQENGTYGLARGGDDKHLIRVQDLDSSLLPGGEADPHGQRRLVFVGDVHGCRDELLRLLHAVAFDRTTDHLILTGDVVSKGPDSVGVLDELTRLNATSVRGNHEDRVLTAAKSMHLAAYSSSSSPTPEQLSLQGPRSPGAAKDAQLLRALKPHHLAFLRRMPLILRIPALPLASSAATETPERSSLSPHKRRAKAKKALETDDDQQHQQQEQQQQQQQPTMSTEKQHAHPRIHEPLLVVHAGLVPGVPLPRQDPYFVTNMRSIHPRTHVPSVLRAGDDDAPAKLRPWADLWGWYNDRLAQGRGRGWGRVFRGFSAARVGENGFGLGWGDDSHDSHDEENGGEREVAAVPQPANKSWAEWLREAFWGRAGEADEAEAAAAAAWRSPRVVVYGHDSKAGLQLRRWSKGLDSGCVRGGRLTALVLDARGRQEVVSVACKEWLD